MSVGKPVVLVDLDGVVFNLTDGVRHYVEMSAWEDGMEHTFPEEVDSWHFVSDHDYTESLIKQAFKSEELFASLEPYEGAVDGVHRLMERAEVFFCSTPYRSNPNSYIGKVSSVQRHFGYEGVRRLILTSDKTLSHGDVLIDDRPDIKGVLKQPEWERIVFDHAYNRDVETIFRMTSWSNDDVDRVINLANEMSSLKSVMYDVPGKV